MTKIKNIKAFEIKDSRGNPTLSVSVYTDTLSASFDVPSGASTGINEAIELRDADGGMRTAIEKIENKILPKLIGLEVTNQKEIDSILLDIDGTDNKSNLGANSMIGVSVACAKVGAKSKGIELFEYLKTLDEIKPSQEYPYLFMVLIEGGKHGDSGSPFQEYQIVPMTTDVDLAYAIGKEIKESLSNALEGDKSKGDEGGFVFSIESVEQPFGILEEAINKAQIKENVVLGTDIAASEFFTKEKYTIYEEDITADELTSMYEAIIKKYNLKMIEDPF